MKKKNTITIWIDAENEKWLKLTSQNNHLMIDELVNDIVAAYRSGNDGR